MWRGGGQSGKGKMINDYVGIDGLFFLFRAVEFHLHHHVHHHLHQFMPSNLSKVLNFPSAKTFIPPRFLIFVFGVSNKSKTTFDLIS